MKNRVVAPEVVTRYQKRIKKMEPTVKKILQDERDDANLGVAEMEVKKAQNMLDHKDEIMARAPRTWIMTSKEKQDAAKRSQLAHQGEVVGLPSDATPKLGGIDRAKEIQTKPKKGEVAKKVDPEAAAMIRGVKRAKRPKKITMFEPEKDARGKPGTKRKKGGNAFAEESGPGRKRQKASGAKSSAPKAKKNKKSTSDAGKLIAAKSAERKKQKAEIPKKKKPKMKSKFKRR